MRLQKLPHRFEITQTQFLAGRDSRQSRARLPQGGPVFVTPCGLEVIRKIGRLAVIKIHDSLDCVSFAVRLHQHGITRERKSIRFQHEVFRDLPRRLQILRHQTGRNRQRLAGVVKTSLICGIDRKLPRGPQIHACKIADGVVIFGVAETPVQCRPRIAGIFSDFLGAHRLNPVHDLPPRLDGRLRGLLRRHFTRRQAPQNQVPARVIPHHRRQSVVRFQIELSRRGAPAVATGAILRNDRPDRFSKLPVESRGGTAERGRREKGGGPKSRHVSRKGSGMARKGLLHKCLRTLSPTSPCIESYPVNGT